MRLSDLTPDDWSALGEYVAYVRDKLGLHTWSIHIEHKACNKNHQASIAPVYGRTHAVIRLSRYWPTLSASEQKHTIIHELLHLQFVGVQSAVEHLDGVISDDMVHLLEASHTESLEYAIDAIAYVLTELFKDPPPLVESEEPDGTKICKYDDCDIA